METPTEKWTEIEHLPEWDEEFYHVYTAKKHGKWLMLKTLRPELKDDPKFVAMIEKEFEVRYNLAHSHIIMINDFEDVPGLGRCIITDDVYGDSLAKLIREGKVTEDHINKITRDLLEALDYIQTNHLVHHPLTASRVIFTENVGNLKLIDVGFDQKNELSRDDTAQDIYDFGVVLSQALDACPDAPGHQRLRKIAARCMNPDPSRRYRSVNALRLSLAERPVNALMVAIILFLVAMVALLVWLNSSARPALPQF
ncbi:MAG: protein kinase [Duncaniella sp.]|nr:protein kinase [Duncaniella sp.]